MAIINPVWNDVRENALNTVWCCKKMVMGYNYQLSHSKTLPRIWTTCLDVRSCPAEAPYY